MKKHLEKLKEENGFTLIEMLIVIMIVSLLLLLVMTNIGGVQGTVKKTTNEGVIQTVKSQMVIYEMDTGEEADPDKLLKAGYIDETQLNSYKKAIEESKAEQPTVP